MQLLKFSTIAVTLWIVPSSLFYLTINFSPPDPLGGSKVKYLNFAITQLSIFLLKFCMHTEAQ